MYSTSVIIYVSKHLEPSSTNTWIHSLEPHTYTCSSRYTIVRNHPYTNFTEKGGNRMARKTFHVLIYGIIALAIIGILSELFTNALNFVTSILIIMCVAARIFSAFLYILHRNKGSTTTSEKKKHRPAVKQKKRKYKNHGKSTSKQTNLTTTRGRKKVRRRPHHLRVIEGNKS